MKKTVLVLISLVLCIPVIALAQQTGGLPALQSELQAVKTNLQNQINDLQNQIKNIQLTPGPQGPAGPQGLAGPKGDTGATGPAGPPGVANGITQATHGRVDGYQPTTVGAGYYATREAVGYYTINTTVPGAFQLGTPDCFVTPNDPQFPFLDTVVCSIHSVEPGPFGAYIAVLCRIAATDYPSDSTFSFICVY